MEQTLTWTAVVFGVGLSSLLFMTSKWILEIIGLKVSWKEEPSLPEVAPVRFSQTNQALVGRQGVAMSPLSPSGYIKIGDIEYQAHATVGMIDAGTYVSVNSVTGFVLNVEKLPDAAG